MVQLADWITKLQPHMVQVWLVQAWNMAYNVSVKFKSPEDRWLWVQRGIQLLRDDGLSYNTNQSLMYREISWIYQHKVGANLDDAHMTYKLHLAQQMQDVFPDGLLHTNELLHPPDAAWKERVRKLREVYKMDPEIVVRVDQEYGPLDWRLPGAHAVLLGRIGPHVCRSQRPGHLAPLHIPNHAPHLLRRRRPGCRRHQRDPRQFFLRPNLALIPTMSATYEKMIAEEKDPGQAQSFRNAHKNFLKEAIPLLYVDGDQDKAAYWFKYLKQTYTNNLFNASEANLSLDEYVFKSVTEDTGETDMNKVTAALLGLIHREFICVIFGEDAKVANTHALIQKIWSHYAAAAKGSESRIGIPELPRPAPMDAQPVARPRIAQPLPPFRRQSRHPPQPPRPLRRGRRRPAPAGLWHQLRRRAGSAAPMTFVEEIPTAHSPESLADRLIGERGLVLLRSALFDSRQARYSLLTARPLLIFRSFGSRCECDGPEHPQFGNPWHVLDSLMARYELLEEIDLPFPLGGCFGYWGYDLKNFVEPRLPPPRRQRSRVARLPGRILRQPRRLRPSTRQNLDRLHRPATRRLPRRRARPSTIGILARPPPRPA